jgi:hypothetical protein
MKRAVRVCSEVNRVFSDVSCAANIAAKKEIKKEKGDSPFCLCSTHGPQKHVWRHALRYNDIGKDEDVNDLRRGPTFSSMPVHPRPLPDPACRGFLGLPLPAAPPHQCMICL